MNGLWVDDNPAKTFLDKLRRQRAIEFMRNRSYLRKLRYNHEMAERDQKAFGKIWEEYGVNVNSLIAEAYGENWDLEPYRSQEEEKNEVSVNQRNADNDDLVATREKSTRSRLDQLQGKPEASLGVVEEEQGRSNERRESSPEESGAQGAQEKEKEMHRLRGERFYRSAGGSGC